MAEPFTRMCVSCRRHRPQREMLRIVKHPEGHAVLDPDFRMPGRGLYLCRDSACIEKARKARFVERGFSVKTEDNFYEKLKDLVQLNG